MTTAVDPKEFRRILGHYPTGVCVITAMLADGMPVGFVVGSFTSVSLSPPLVGFFPDRSSTTWPRVKAVGRFCVNVLAAHQGAICAAFASKAKNKFADIPYRLSQRGNPILDDVVASIDCNLHSVQEAGDHFIALGEVQTLAVEAPHAPLLFYRGAYGQFRAHEPLGQQA